MQHHLVCVVCTKPYRNLYITNRVGDVIDDAIQQSVEIEGGGDQIRGPLQPHEELNEVAAGVNTRQAGAAGLNGGGEGGHRCPL
jgi:hypothetical protein